MALCKKWWDLDSAGVCHMGLQKAALPAPISAVRESSPLEWGFFADALEKSSVLKLYLDLTSSHRLYLEGKFFLQIYFRDRCGVRSWHIWHTVKASYNARRLWNMASELLQAVRVAWESSSFLSQSWSFTHSPACCLCHLWSMVKNMAFGANHAEQRFLLLWACLLLSVLCTQVLEQSWQLGEKWAGWEEPGCSTNTIRGECFSPAALPVLTGAGICWIQVSQFHWSSVDVLAAGSLSHTPCCCKWVLSSCRDFSACLGTLLLLLSALGSSCGTSENLSRHLLQLYSMKALNQAPFPFGCTGNRVNRSAGIRPQNCWTQLSWKAENPFQIWRKAAYLSSSAAKQSI